MMRTFSNIGSSGKPPMTALRPVSPPQLPVIVTSSPRFVVGFGLTSGKSNGVCHRDLDQPAV